VVIVTRHHQKEVGMESNGDCSYTVVQLDFFLNPYGHINKASDG